MKITIGHAGFELKEKIKILLNEDSFLNMDEFSLNRISDSEIRILPITNLNNLNRRKYWRKNYKRKRKIDKIYERSNN